MTKRIILALLVAPVVAGCGSNKPTTSSGTASANSPGASAYAYSRCMRSHGVTNFPDPKVSVSGNSVRVAIGVSPSITGSPKFNSAQKACSKILPAQTGDDKTEEQAHERNFLAFAQCVRGKGIHDFPDPNAQGQLPLPSIVAAGVDIHSQQFLAATTSCASVTHGMITAAQIRAGLSATH